MPGSVSSPSVSKELFHAGCFGKLPSFGDFVRHNAAGREALAFDEWLHHGMYFAQGQLGQQWDRSFKGAPAYNFLFCPEGSGRFLVGPLFPSEDKSQRKYPFVVSVFVDLPRFGTARAHLIPVMFSGFFEEARLFFMRAFNGLPMKDIVEQTQALSIQVSDHFEKAQEQHNGYLGQTTLETLMTRLFGDFSDQRKYVLVRNLADILIPLRGRNLSRLPLGLRFPLDHSADTAAHVACFWLEVSLRLLGLATFMPFLFWTVPRGENPSHLFLFFRQPSPRNFVQLLQPDLQTDGVCVLEREWDEAARTEAHGLSPQHRSLLDSKSLTLSDFVRRL